MSIILMRNNMSEEQEHAFGLMLGKLYIPKKYVEVSPYDQQVKKQKIKNGWAREDNDTFARFKHYVNYQLESVDDKPAIVETYYRDQRMVYLAQWLKQDVLHRIGAPAELGMFDQKSYYLNSFRYDKKEYWDHPELINHKLQNIIAL